MFYYIFRNKISLNIILKNTAMIKGTDIVMGVQILVMRYTNFLNLFNNPFSEETIPDQQVFSTFTNDQMVILSTFKEELQGHLYLLGNEKNHCNADNLQNYIVEKQWPSLQFKDLKSRILKTIEAHYLYLIESYQRILKIQALPINIEATFLRHLAELQTALSVFIHNYDEPSYEDIAVNKKLVSA